MAELPPSKRPRKNEREVEKNQGGRAPRKELPVVAVVYEVKNRLLVVDKPHDIRINGDFDLTVEKALFEQKAVVAGGSIRFANRLDYATSGLVCLALDKRACAAISFCFANRHAVKSYLALLEGHLPDDEMAFDKAIAVDPSGGFKMVCSEKGRNAMTTLRVLERGKVLDRPATKVVVTLHTGRRHQIRLHLADAGFPIVGDCTYDPDEKRSETVPRMMLHSWRLSCPLSRVVKRRRWKLVPPESELEEAGTANGPVFAEDIELEAADPLSVYFSSRW